MTRREQIIEILNKTLYIGEEYDTRKDKSQYWIEGLERSADAILAIALDVPSDDEVIDMAHERYPDYDGIPDSHTYSFCSGAEYMKNKILKRDEKQR